MVTTGSDKRTALLLAPFSQPHRDILAANFAQLCRLAGIDCDVYYTAERPGGIFAAHGSLFVGGRHQEAMARLLAVREPTVFQAPRMVAFGSLLANARAGVTELQEGIAGTLAQWMAWTGCRPTQALAVQTAGLPPALGAGIVPYLLPELTVRSAVVVPLELSAEEARLIARLGISTVHTVAAAGTSDAAWRQAGCQVVTIERLAGDETYETLSYRVAERHLPYLAAVDYLEPVLAAYRIPAGLQQGRAAVFSEDPGPGWERLADLIERTGQPVVYCRWSGGAMRSVNSDREFIPLSRRNVSVHVVEPGRPVFQNLPEATAALAGPETTVFDAEPDDALLRRWAAESRVLATLVTHSGELSHDDAVCAVYDLCAHRRVKAGIGVFAQRYEHEPDALEPMLMPLAEGGVHELCEPVLHSSGYGICFEYLADPQALARQMRAAQDRIAARVGEHYAPRGVYCYLDAMPGDWERPATALWEAIAGQGFEYVLSSVAAGTSRILYRKGDFIVLALVGTNCYPYSPFVRIHRATDLSDAVDGMRSRGPGWALGVIDLPVQTDIPALALGDPYRIDRPRFGDLIAYLGDMQKSPTLVNATPHTIVRYARLLNDLGLVACEQSLG